MDDYQTLGLLPTATPEQIKSAYRRLSVEQHPDHNGSPDLFKNIVTAYQRLSLKSQLEVDRIPNQYQYQIRINASLEELVYGAKKSINTQFGSVYFFLPPKTDPQKKLTYSFFGELYEITINCTNKIDFEILGNQINYQLKTIETRQCHYGIDQDFLIRNRRLIIEQLQN